jgi:transcriptional regulator with GAF, ATPase, and Fis domain
MVGAATFRGDLYARIAGLKVQLPPLRERREDLGLLTAALLPRIAPGVAERVRFDPRVIRAFLGYRWPLNIRELEKTLGAAVALAGAAPVGPEHLPPAIAAVLTPPAPAAPPATEEADDTLPFSSEELSLREELMRLLDEHRGNIAAVARAMGKARMQIQRWLKRFGIEPEAYRR